MANLLLFAAGTGLIAFVLYDFLRTTISLSGLGPASSVVAHTLWRLSRQFEPWSERQLGLAFRGFIGPTILAAIAAAWIVLHLVGYTLMYAASSSLRIDGTDAPATLIERIAFAGSALSTLGASIAEPTNGWWDALSMIAAVNGMIVLTLSVSFILNVLQTTAAARVLAARYHALRSSGGGHGSCGTLQRIAPLGPDFCKMAVDLSGSSLSGMFVPSDPVMDFAKVVSEICDLIQSDGGLTSNGSTEDGEFAELRWGIALLGRQSPTGEDLDGIDAAGRWARYFSLP